MGMDRIQVTLDWREDLYFEGRAGDVEIAVDGEATRAQSPMQAMATALAGCMGIDIVHILGKMRSPADRVRVSVDGERARTDPRRFERIRLSIRVDGDVPERNLQRAVEMSREKYCSVLQTFRDDVEVVIETGVSRAA